METAEINEMRLQSSTVGEAMAPVVTVQATMPLSDAAELIRSRRGRALVVDNGDDSPAIFTEFDIVKAVASREPTADMTVGDHHTGVAITATPDWTLDRALATMMRGQFRHLAVMENGKTIGLLAMRDILDVVLESQEPDEEFDPGETVELSALVPSASSRLLHNLRRGAKQHMVAAKCDCELDWIEILIGQAEERSDLSAVEIQELWERRPLCPTLHAMGGGGD